MYEKRRVIPPFCLATHVDTGHRQDLPAALDQCGGHNDQCCDHRNDADFGRKQEIMVKLKMLLALFIKCFCIHRLRPLPELRRLVR